MGTPACFSAFLSKGVSHCDFLFSAVGNKTLPEMALLLKERIFAPLFLLEEQIVDRPSLRREVKMEMTELLPLRVYALILRNTCHICFFWSSA